MRFSAVFSPFQPMRSSASAAVRADDAVSVLPQRPLAPVLPEAVPRLRELPQELDQRVRETGEW